MGVWPNRLRWIHEKLCEGVLPSDADRAYLKDLAKRSLPDDQAKLLLRALALLCDPSTAPSVEPYLHRHDAPELAREALRALCRAGLQSEYRDYIMHAVNPGFDWDRGRDVRVSALYGIGDYLCDHRDPQFAHLIAELVDRNDDPMLRTLDEDQKVNTARMAAGLAMGGDSATLALHDDDEVLLKPLVARFLAERRDG
jgi:hypothetical protein